MSKSTPEEVDEVVVVDDVAPAIATEIHDDTVIEDFAANDEPINVGRVRKWAKATGLDVPARGRISDDVIERYRARDQHDTETETQVDAAVQRADEPWRPWHEDKAPGDRTLERWHRGTDVQWVQTALGVEQTGDFDEATENAVKRYQQVLGLNGDGRVDRYTWGNLRGGNFVTIQTLENGFIHAQRATGVIEVQARLATRGYYDGFAHGLADEATQVAYGRYQQDLGLLANGIPERSSLERLGFRVSD